MPLPSPKRTSSHTAGPTTIIAAVHWPAEWERERIRSGGERKREEEGVTEEPSSLSPRPLAPDPLAVVALAAASWELQGVEEGVRMGALEE